MEVPRRRAFINITHEVETALAESRIREGLALVTPMHITASAPGSAVFYGEFDGRRRKRVLIKLIGE